VALGPLAKLAAFRLRKPPAPTAIGAARPSSPERQGDDDVVDDDAGGRMSFLDHLDELRRRLVAAALSLAFGTLVAFFFIDRIFTFIMRPLYEKLPAGSKLIYTEPTEAFFLKLKIALLAGVVIGAPLIMAQLWLFIAPGLYAREKRFALPFVVMASLFFVGGAAFNHYVLFPIAWVFLAGFSTDYMMFMPRIAPVFSLYAMLMLAMGLIFEMPAVILVLARMGLATAGFLWKNIKYAILLIFVASAVITPTGDPMTQALMAGPMVALYIISIGLAWVFGKRRRRAED
jgi:sec-independent protein translocase protein TatC